jgi:hypothetical protein
MIGQSFYQDDPRGIDALIVTRGAWMSTGISVAALIAKSDLSTPSSTKLKHQWLGRPMT